LREKRAWVWSRKREKKRKLNKAPDNKGGDVWGRGRRCGWGHAWKRGPVGMEKIKERGRLSTGARRYGWLSPPLSQFISMSLNRHSPDFRFLHSLFFPLNCG
jgi:hypothetical protein